MPVANTGKKATIDGKAVLLLIFLISFATNLIAPIATTIAMYLKQFSGSSTTYPKIVESMDSRAERYNECMTRLQELEQEGKIFVIAPESTYGVGRTTTDVIKLRRLYDEGYELTEKRMQELRAYLG